MFYLIYGSDNFRSEKHLHKVVKFYSQRTSFCSVVDFADKEKSKDILDLKALFLNKTLFSGTKLVLLKNLFQSTSAEFRRQLLKLFQDSHLASAKDIMIIIYENKDIEQDLLKKWLDKNTKGKKVFSSLSSRELRSWIKTKEKETGIHLTPLAAEMLAVSYGDDLRSLEQVFLKMSLSGVKVINKEILAELASLPLPSNIFKFLDKLIEKRIASAVYFLEIELNKNVYPPLLLALIVNQIRNLLKIKTGFSSKISANKLKIHPFVYKKLLPIAKSIDLSSLKKIYSRLSFYDYQMKSGLLEGNLALEMMLLDIKRILK